MLPGTHYAFLATACLLGQKHIVCVPTCEVMFPFIGSYTPKPQNFSGIKQFISFLKGQIILHILSDRVEQCEVV